MNKKNLLKGVKCFLLSEETTVSFNQWILGYKAQADQEATQRFKENPPLMIKQQTESEEKELINSRIDITVALLEKKNVLNSFNFKNLAGFSQKEILIFYSSFVQKNQLDKSRKGGEIHHLVPKHMWNRLYNPFLVSKEEALKFICKPYNEFYLSKTQHCEAHAILFIACGCFGDYSALKLRNTLPDQVIQEQRKTSGQYGGFIRAKQQEENQANMYSADWQAKYGVGAQREEGRAFFDKNHQVKMATLGGLANSPAQQKSRSDNGKLFVSRMGPLHNQANGKKMGLKNQSPEVQEFLSKKVVWENGGKKYTTFPHESTKDLRETLESYVAREKPGDHSNFAKLIKGQSNIWYGWTILEVLDPDPN